MTGRLTDSDLPPALPALARHVTITARSIGCTCAQPDVRYDRGERIAVILHAPPCPLAALNDGPEGES